MDVAVISEAGVAQSMGSCGRGRRVPGRLLLCVNRGSELFEVGSGGLRRCCAGGQAARLCPDSGSDSMRDILSFLARRGVGPGLVLVVGSDFGPAGGIAGSDSLLLIPEAARMIAVSVGEEPGGVPAGVLHVGGGRQALLRLLDEQLSRRKRGRVRRGGRGPGVDHARDRDRPAAPPGDRVAVHAGCRGRGDPRVGGGSSTGRGASGAGGGRL